MVKYIYTGFPKTGTKTMDEAFRILGYKVYHVQQQMVDAKIWNKFLSYELNDNERLDLLYNTLKPLIFV